MERLWLLSCCIGCLSKGTWWPPAFSLERTDTLLSRFPKADTCANSRARLGLAASASRLPCTVDSPKSRPPPCREREKKSASNGLQALDKVQDLNPELVLLDIQMPAMNGLEVTQELRKRFPSIRVILLSVDDGQEVRVSCEVCGAHGFVSKIRLPELSSEIRRVFA